MYMRISLTMIMVIFVQFRFWLVSIPFHTNYHTVQTAQEFLPDAQTTWLQSLRVETCREPQLIVPPSPTDATRAFPRLLHRATFHACEGLDCKHFDRALQRRAAMRCDCKSHQWRWQELPMFDLPLFDPWAHAPETAVVKKKKFPWGEFGFCRAVHSVHNSTVATQDWKQNDGSFRFFVP